MGDPLIALRADRSRQMLHQQRNCLGGQRIADRLMPDRVGAFNRVIQRPHARRYPEPVRRRQREQRVIDHRTWHHPLIVNAALYPRGLIGNASGMRVLGRGQSSGNSDVNQFPPRQCAVYRDLAGVDRTAAAEADQGIRIHALNFPLELIHGAARDVLDHSREYRRAGCPECSGDFVENGKSRQRGDDDGPLESASFHLARERRNLARAVDYTLEAAQIKFTRQDFNWNRLRFGNHVGHPNRGIDRANAASGSNLDCAKLFQVRGDNGITRRLLFGQLACVAAWAQNDDDPLRQLRAGHPRLILLDSDLDRLRNLVRDHRWPTGSTSIWRRNPIVS